MPTRGGVAAGIRDLPETTRKDVQMERSTQRVYLRACVFDIETTNFSAESNADIMTCVSFLPLDSDEVVTFAITYEEMMSPGRDRALLERTLDFMSQFDIVIGHNIAGFDLNWLTTRMLYHDIPFPNSVFYYDTYSAAKRIGIRGWKNLGSLTAFFDIDGEKTKIFRPDWMEALNPDRKRFDKAIEDVVYHCEQDVIANRQLFDVLWPNDKRQRSLKYYDKWM